MSTNDSKKSISGYSADYRAAYPQKPKKDPGKSRPSRPKKRPDRPKREPEPIRKHSGRMENDTEIDDFLPESENTEEEHLLTKWEDELEPGAPVEPHVKKRGRHWYGIFTGTVVLLLALVGVGFIAATITMKIHSALTDDTRLRNYDQFLTVVVAQDPQPFDSPDKADPEFILNAAIWKTMMSDTASTYTEYDDAGRTLVPLGDVADACHELFGPDCQLQPKNPEQETFFEYDSAAAQFHVALYSLDSTYVPYTESAKNQNGSVVLRVGYVPPSDETRAQSGVSSSAGTPKPTKYMEYVIKTDPKTNEEYIYAIHALKQ